ncbi:MAG: VOC family protein [Kiritimatiellia bacterium]|nr:VOC family protein [Kiritimatiellia bacterium]
MKFEHIAFNVSDPVALAEWYRLHLGLEVVRSSASPPFGHFLRDDGGTMMLEVYCNPPDQIPAYAEMDPLLLHLALVSEDPDDDIRRLTAAGATLVSDQTITDGSRIAVLRDPWGLCLQLCRRATRMVCRPDS